MVLYDVPPERLLVPLITYDDFLKALNKAHSSVGADELLKFVSWTKEFGQEGQSAGNRRNGKKLAITEWKVMEFIGGRKWKEEGIISKGREERDDKKREEAIEKK